MSHSDVSQDAMGAVTKREDSNEPFPDATLFHLRPPIARGYPGPACKAAGKSSRFGIADDSSNLADGESGIGQQLLHKQAACFIEHLVKPQSHYAQLSVLRFEH
jgi:hypothetical protein